MNIRLIYPKWPKLYGQREFHLPPHGPVVFAATVPLKHDLKFTDENVQTVDFEEDVDLVCISVMLTCQLPRGWEIADRFRALNIPVIFGGIASSLHVEETTTHADAVFVGEAEGRFEQVLADLQAGQLKKIYNYHEHPVAIDLVGTARRSILDYSLYNYRGVQMVDLIHASRGCRFGCYPCCVSYLGGQIFRPRPIDKVVEEVESIPNNRLFFVDNSLAQNKQWELDLFRELAPLKRSIICHPIEDDDEVLRAAADAGAWWVYQAIVKPSKNIRDRVRRLKEHDIAVEGTILFGLDDQDETSIRELIDFLLEIELDLAEFTILTPFPHTKAFSDLESEKRILTKDWKRYTADQIVYKPAQISPEKLEELFYSAWEMFYAKESQELRMARVLKKAMLRERQLGTARRFQKPRPGRSVPTDQLSTNKTPLVGFGRNLKRS